MTIHRLWKECIWFLFNDKPGMSREQHIKSPAEGPHCMHIKYYQLLGNEYLKPTPVIIYKSMHKNTHWNK